MRFRKEDECVLLLLHLHCCVVVIILPGRYFWFFFYSVSVLNRAFVRILCHEREHFKFMFMFIHLFWLLDIFFCFQYPTTKWWWLKWHSLKINSKVIESPASSDFYLARKCRRWKKTTTTTAISIFKHCHVPFVRILLFVWFAISPFSQLMDDFCSLMLVYLVCYFRW